MKILADASLPCLSEAFPKPFELSLYHHQDELSKLLKGQQILLCRANLKVNEALLNGQSLDCVATASSGTDHIDTHFLHTQSIELIDAKGSNAIAVADYVIASLAFLQRYKGFSGSKAAVIGVGEVGSQVAKRLAAANLEVFCYDPPRGESDPQFHSCPLENLRHCDLITIHANLHSKPPYPSKNLLDQQFLKQLKPGVVIINASRGGIVNEEALLKLSNYLVYCTDVYHNEPAISNKIVDFATLCTPHIAGHSIEGKSKAVAMLSQKLHARYKLSPPMILTTLGLSTELTEQQNWQETVLSLYNPITETKLLKRADNLESTFIALRKAHQNRHDFCVFNARSLSKQIRQILGC